MIYKLFNRSGTMTVLAFATAFSLLGFLFLAHPAYAGIGISVAPNFPASITAGTTGQAVSMTINNGSTADVGNITLDGIFLTPSCGDSNSPCTTPDPGVFSVSSTATGADACTGINFTNAIVDAGTGRVQFTPSSTITLSLGQTCTINFTVDVLKVPAHDATGAAGIQTFQIGTVAAHDTDVPDLPGTGTGTDLTTVGKASPTIATVPSATGPIGTVLNDTATLSGGSSPTGDVTFTLYPPSDATCSAAAIYTDTDPTAPYATSPGFTSNTAGTYHWKAAYAGDANNNPATSACSDEAVVIAKADTTTVTHVHNAAHTDITNTSVPVGTVIHDNATVAPQVGSIPITGNITYTSYSNLTCNAAGLLSTETVFSPTAESTAVTLGAGDYSYKAVYAGDANYNGSTGACEPFTITKASPTIATTLSNLGPVAVGTAVHDSSALTGATPAAGGTVAYTVYTNNLCTLGAQSAGAAKAVVNGVVADSDPITFNTAGTFYWQAVYSGDANNNGATSNCTSETLVVEKASPTISTTLVPAGPVAIGASVHDSSILTGASATAGGTVKYSAYAGANTCTGTDLLNSTKTVTNGIVPDSDSISFANAGTYSFQAVYSGDANNNGATSTCSTEQLVVGKSSPTILTTPSAGGPIGTVLNDTATLSGGSSPTGNVTFKLFPPSDLTCSGTEVFSQVDGTAPYETGPGYTSLVAGTYHWTADYAGDANNNPVSSGCTLEPVVIVSNPDVHVAKTAAKTPINSGDTASFTITTSNAGPGTATNVVTTDTLPGGLAWTENPDNANCVIANGVLTCTYATMAEGASDSVTVQAVTNTEVCGPLNNTANVTAANEDQTKTDDNSASASIMVNCLFPTRTIGFWQTHTAYTESVFAAHGPITLGGMTISTNGQLFGGFLAGISKTSDGTKRSAVDQARMQLAQQYLGAVLNCQAFGCSASTLSLLTQASTDFSSGTASQILADASALNAYNNSGDALGNPSAGSATPKDSKALANMTFWDNLH
ncbi:MAG: hypothetical protein ACM3KM_00550 [Acidobacteriaceae bacterium]